MCLGLVPAPATARTSVLVLDLDVDGGPTEVGLAIDDILDVVALGVDQIDAPPRLALGPAGLPAGRGTRR